MALTKRTGAVHSSASCRHPTAVHSAYIPRLEPDLGDPQLNLITDVPASLRLHLHRKPVHMRGTLAEKKFERWQFVSYLIGNKFMKYQVVGKTLAALVP